MAITLNSVSQAATAGSSSFSVSHTVNAGANRVMLVFVSCPNSSDFMAAGSVSYGGTSLGAAVLTPSGNAGINLYNYVFRMTNPPVGTANVVITPSGTAYLNVRVVTLDGVDQTTPISSSNSAKLSFAPGSSYSLPITSPAGGVAVGALVCRNTSSALGVLNGATEIGTITSDTASRMIVSMKADATELDYSFTGSQPTLAASAVALNAATGGGTPPTGTVTLGTITPNSTGASVPFTYSAADQTGFEYQLNETGTLYPISASPATPTGLTPSTAYTIRVRAINASGNGAWSAPANFTTSAPAAQVPQGTVTIGTVTTTQTTASVPYTYSLSDQTSIEYRIDGGAAVTASSSPQALTGLTAGTTYGIQFRAVNGFGNGAWSTSAPFTTAAVTLGVQAQDIPSAGANGAGFLYNDIAAQGAAPTDLMHYEILTWPSAGTLTVNPDSSFSFTGAPDGTYSFTYRGFRNGVSYGDYMVTLQVGNASTGPSPLKVWNGSAWVSAQVKRWSGSAWVDVSLCRWNGAEWV